MEEEGLACAGDEQTKVCHCIDGEGDLYSNLGVNITINVKNVLWIIPYSFLWVANNRLMPPMTLRTKLRRSHASPNKLVTILMI